jgi:hypothetical protein
MKLFPTEKFEIETGMTREEVIKRLREVTEIEPRYAFKRAENGSNKIIAIDDEEQSDNNEENFGPKLFKGRISYSSFVIRRNVSLIAGRCPLEINGSFCQGEEGSTVSLEIGVGNERKGFLLIGLCLYFGISLVFLGLSFTDWRMLIPFFINLVLSPLFFVMVRYYFYFDINETKPILMHVLKKRTKQIVSTESQK